MCKTKVLLLGLQAQMNGRFQSQFKITPGKEGSQPSLRFLQVFLRDSLGFLEKVILISLLWCDIQTK